MLRKPQAQIISIDSARGGGFDPEPTPQAVSGKRAFFGNQHTERRFFGMYQIWRCKVAQHYRVPVSRFDEQILDGIRAEAMQERRAA